MNAQDMMNTLLQLQMAGVDLNQLEIVISVSVYDNLGQCEIVQSWPSSISVNNNELVIGE